MEQEFIQPSTDELEQVRMDIQARLAEVNASLVGRLDQLTVDGYEVLETGIPNEEDETLAAKGIPERLEDLTKVMDLVTIKDAIYLSNEEGTGKLTAVLGAYTIFKRPLAS